MIAHSPASKLRGTGTMSRRLARDVLAEMGKGMVNSGINGSGAFLLREISARGHLSKRMKI